MTEQLIYGPRTEQVRDIIGTLATLVHDDAKRLMSAQRDNLEAYERNFDALMLVVTSLPKDATYLACQAAMRYINGALLGDFLPFSMAAMIDPCWTVVQATIRVAVVAVIYQDAIDPKVYESIMVDLYILRGQTEEVI